MQTFKITLELFLIAVKVHVSGEMFLAREGHITIGHFTFKQFQLRMNFNVTMKFARIGECFITIFVRAFEYSLIGIVLELVVLSFEPILFKVFIALATVEVFSRQRARRTRTGIVAITRLWVNFGYVTVQIHLTRKLFDAIFMRAS